MNIFARVNFVVEWAFIFLQIIFVLRKICIKQKKDFFLKTKVQYMCSKEKKIIQGGPWNIPVASKIFLQPYWSRNLFFFFAWTETALE